MRGRRRLTVLLAWTAASCGAAALVGAALGLLATWVGVPPAPGAAAAALVGAAALAGVAPPSIRRQVPQVWGRILDPHLTAVLYGVRLGIGPATMLSTWLWWAATLAAATLGVGASAAVGALFALSRTVLNVAVAGRARRVAAWQRRDRLVTRSVSGAAALLGVLVLVAGCAGDDGPSRGGDAAEAPATTPTDPDPTTPETTVPAPTTPPPAAEDLGTVLPSTLTGYVPITDQPGADTALDLDAAAAAEVDPEGERTLLETRGFLRGYTRAWRDDADRVVVATVHEFPTPEDAALYLQDGIITLDGFAAAPFDVPWTPGARGFTQEDGSGYITQGVTFSCGERWFLVYVNGPPETTTVEEARRLATLIDPDG